jgi:hypothetical protein
VRYLLLVAFSLRATIAWSLGLGVAGAVVDHVRDRRGHRPPIVASLTEASSALTA